MTLHVELNRTVSDLGHNSVLNFDQIYEKLNKTKITVIGRERRFKDKTHITPGPGPTLRIEQAI
jgi:hypothetical protein